MSARKSCRACGRWYRGAGRTALVLGPSSSVKARVCPDCAKRALLVVQSPMEWRERVEEQRQEENREVRRRAAQQRRELAADEPLPE